jgi:hypothetical protein
LPLELETWPFPLPLGLDASPFPLPLEFDAIPFPFPPLLDALDFFVFIDFIMLLLLFGFFLGLIVGNFVG